MEEPNRVNAQAGEMKAKLQNVIEKANGVCERLRDQTAAAAKATDKTIRDYPYQAMGIALCVGVLVGVLAMRSRRD